MAQPTAGNYSNGGVGESSPTRYAEAPAERAAGQTSGTSKPARWKRALRACDRCHHSRTRCDGHLPCTHCTDYDLACTYNRQPRKRGRGKVASSKSDVAPVLDLTDISRQQSSSVHEEQPREVNPDQDFETQSAPTTVPDTPAGSGSQGPNQSLNYFHQPSPSNQHSHANIGPHQIQLALSGSNSSCHPNPQSTLQSYYHNESLSQQIANSSDPEVSAKTGPAFFEWPDRTFVPAVVAGHDSADYNMLDHEGIIANTAPPPNPMLLQTTGQLWTDRDRQTSLPFPTQRHGATSADISATVQDIPARLPSILSQLQPESTSQFRFLNPDCRYPVLRPLLPYISTVIGTKDACDLLEMYFAKPSNALFECASPYVLTQIFRRKTFLRDYVPRNTAPALLAAMLWVTAQTSDAPVFKTSHRARSRICDELYAVCLSLLHPSAQQKTGQKQPFQISEGQVLGEGHNHGECRPSPLGSSHALDTVITYALLGVVVSGGERKGDCLKWWNKAWAMAREIGLNREDSNDKLPEATSMVDPPSGSANLGTWTPLAREEMKEERRRTWWLLYIADRHLALCYNAPLNILDSEYSVYQPLDEETWQDLDLNMNNEFHLPRNLGPFVTMTGVGLFEYFLPLMAILGDIIDLHHLKQHPRFGGHLDLDSSIRQVERSLEAYQASLKAFEDSVMFDLADKEPPLTCSSPQTIFNAYRDLHPWTTTQVNHKTVIAYSNHLLHVLYILLHGTWDPISMLDSAEQSLSQSQSSFVKCATHAISAAGAVSEILKFDPELSFMPYLFGIYLLHGSFVLLIFADKIEIATSQTVSQACETMIRAHEVCVTTLNTEYQRNFRKVLRSALYNMHGTMAIDNKQHQVRRREFLSMYQWSNGGKGLAI